MKSTAALSFLPPNQQHTATNPSQPDTPRDEYTKLYIFSPSQYNVCSVTNVDVISFYFFFILFVSAIQICFIIVDTNVYAVHFVKQQKDFRACEKWESITLLPDNFELNSRFHLHFPSPKFLHLGVRADCRCCSVAYNITSVDRVLCKKTYSDVLMKIFKRFTRYLETHRHVLYGAAFVCSHIHFCEWTSRRFSRRKSKIHRAAFMSENCVFNIAQANIISENTHAGHEFKERERPSSHLIANVLRMILNYAVLSVKEVNVHSAHTTLHSLRAPSFRSKTKQFIFTYFFTLILHPSMMCGRMRTTTTDYMSRKTWKTFQ